MPVIVLLNVDANIIANMFVMSSKRSLLLWRLRDVLNKSSPTFSQTIQPQPTSLAWTLYLYI